MNKIIENIKKSKSKLYIALSGGGSESISLLLRDGGASSIFVGAQIPYCEDELRFLIGSYTKAVSLPVAKQLSKVGYTRSFSDELEVKCIGIGLTCSLAKAEKERVGREHKVCVAVSDFDKNGTHTLFSAEIIFIKERTRREEEEIVSSLILMLADHYMNSTKTHPLITGYELYGLTSEEVGNSKMFFSERIKNDEESD